MIQKRDSRAEKRGAALLRAVSRERARDDFRAPDRRACELVRPPAASPRADVRS